MKQVQGATPAKFEPTASRRLAWSMLNTTRKYLLPGDLSTIITSSSEISALHNDVGMQCSLLCIGLRDDDET